MIGEILLHIEKTLSKARSRGMNVVCGKYSLVVCGSGCNPRKILEFLRLFKLGAAFKLTQNCFINMRISFS